MILFYEIIILNRRSRNIQHEPSPFEVILDTLNINPNFITVDIRNNDNGNIFTLKVEGVKVGI